MLRRYIIRCNLDLCSHLYGCTHGKNLCLDREKITVLLGAKIQLVLRSHTSIAQWIEVAGRYESGFIGMLSGLNTNKKRNRHC